MPNVCYFTGKKTSFGNQISRRGKPKYLGGVGIKTTGVTPRKFKPNIQKVRVLIDGRVQRIKVSTKAIRMGLVTKPPRRTWGKNHRRIESLLHRGVPPTGVAEAASNRATASVAWATETRIPTVHLEAPQSVGPLEESATTDRERRLTHQLFKDIIGRRQVMRHLAGADVSRKTHAFASLQSTIYVADPRPVSDDMDMLADFIVRDGVVKVAEKVPSAEQLATVDRLRSAYVTLQPGHEYESLDIAAALVKVMRQLLPHALYPVVIGPINEYNLPLADKAYSLSVRVTHRDYDEYMKHEGRLRGPASRLR
jgi:large subunit ribosomal protein L28